MPGDLEKPGDHLVEGTALDQAWLQATSLPTSSLKLSLTL